MQTKNEGVESFARIHIIAIMVGKGNGSETDAD
jgi:hypothetical protein